MMNNIIPYDGQKTKKIRDSSIRRALTTLKKSQCITSTNIGEEYTILTLLIDNGLMSPKKTRKQRLKHKKVSI